MRQSWTTEWVCVRRLATTAADAAVVDALESKIDRLATACEFRTRLAIVVCRQTSLRTQHGHRVVLDPNRFVKTARSFFPMSRPCRRVGELRRGGSRDGRPRGLADGLRLPLDGGRREADAAAVNVTTAPAVEVS